MSTSLDCCRLPHEVNNQFQFILYSSGFALYYKAISQAQQKHPNINNQYRMPHASIQRFRAVGWQAIWDCRNSGGRVVHRCRYF